MYIACKYNGICGAARLFCNRGHYDFVYFQKKSVCAYASADAAGGEVSDDIIYHRTCVLFDFYEPDERRVGID